MDWGSRGGAGEGSSKKRTEKGWGGAAPDRQVQREWDRHAGVRSKVKVHRGWSPEPGAEVRAGRPARWSRQADGCSCTSVLSPTPAPFLLQPAGRTSPYPISDHLGGASRPLPLGVRGRARLQQRGPRVPFGPHPFTSLRTSKEIEGAAAFSDPPRPILGGAGRGGGGYIRLHLQTLQRKLIAIRCRFASHLNIVQGAPHLPQHLSHLGVLPATRTLAGWVSLSLSSRAASAVAR